MSILKPWTWRASAARRRLGLTLEGTLIYAVGDVHGCLDELLLLEEMIEADAEFHSGHKVIVMLGDYVDRGPASSAVLDHLMAPPPPGFERICLTGNHEVALLDYCEGRLSRADWLPLGADATLVSYGVNLDYLNQAYRSSAKIDAEIRKLIPARHLRFLHDLPIMVETERFIFVHAGIRPGIDLDAQKDFDLIQIRSDFLDYPHGLKQWVIHGHTPVSAAVPRGRKLNIDTGAFHTGRLSAVRIWRGRGHVIST